MSNIYANDNSDSFCTGRSREITWARHKKTGKFAPLVAPRNEMKPNIILVPCGTDAPIYFIQQGADATHINHFADCPEAHLFRRPVGDK